MNDNLNVERNKRLLMRMGDLKLKHRKNCVHSKNFTASGSSYSIDVSTNKIMNSCIISKLDVVTNTTNMDGTEVITGEFHVGNGFNQYTNTIVQGFDKSILVGGNFTKYSGVTANRIVKLTSIGEIDSTFVSGFGFNGGLNVILYTQDKNYICGGFFTAYNEIVRNRIVKLTPTGKIDTSFNVGSGFNGTVQTIIETLDGGFLCGGYFTTYNGQTANRIVKLKQNGDIDSSFNSGVGFDSYCNYIIQASDESVYVGGNFNTYSNQSVKHFLKLTSNGDIDTSFTLCDMVDCQITSVAKTSDDKFLIGGNFTPISGTSANRVIKLLSNGDIDSSFNSNNEYNGFVTFITETTDNNYLIGGNFTTYSGISANRIIKLDINGNVNSCFNSGSGLNGQITCGIQIPHGGILIGGNFTTYKNIQYNNILKLSPKGTSTTFTYY